jgi:hypothetical protein
MAASVEANVVGLGGSRRYVPLDVRGDGGGGMDGWTYVEEAGSTSFVMGLSPSTVGVNPATHRCSRMASSLFLILCRRGLAPGSGAFPVEVGAVPRRGGVVSKKCEGCQKPAGPNLAYPSTNVRGILLNKGFVRSEPGEPYFAEPRTKPTLPKAERNLSHATLPSGRARRRTGRPSQDAKAK